MMPRRRILGAGLGLAWVLASASAMSLAQESGTGGTAQKFLQGLRDRGYHDLAIEYIERLRNDPATPAELKTLLDYEEGRGLLDEASKQADLDRSRELLEEARKKLDRFTRANPNHPRAPEALVQMARLLLERGQVASLQAAEETAAEKKRVRLAEARASFTEARTAFDRAIEPLKAAYEGFGKFIPEGDPRRALRDQAHRALMDAELQRALVDYEDAQTYDPGSAERNERLDTARARFEDVYNRYRTWLAGFFAHLWEGKCYEEKGELGPAQAIYNELMQHDDPTLLPLQRKVGYFRIIVNGKRGEHPLAVDRAAEWLRAFPDAARSPEGIGVKFELAKNILAQLPALPENEQPVAIRRATDLLADVVRYHSPQKPEAIALLKKYRPAAALRASAIANLSYDDAYSQAEAAISTHEWDRAIELLRHAVKKANPRKDVEKANRARYMMAYAYFMGERFYEADVTAEHLVRRYPQGGLSPKAAEIAMAALTNAYNTFASVDHTNELNRLVDLARYVAETWADTDQGDAARMTLGEIALGQGRYADASAAFESVREKSARRLDAMVKSGDAHWRNGLLLRSQGHEEQAEAEARKARELMETALQARRDAGVPATDPGLLGNLNALAEIFRAQGRPRDALALLEPAAQALGDGSVDPEIAPLRAALLTIQLRAHIADGQADQAIADMAALEKAGAAGESLTQLYFELGRSLKQEMDALAKKIDSKSQARLEQTRAAYTKFLQALAASQTGQTYESLMFAGESLLGLGQAQEAGAIFDRVLKTYASDATFQQQPNASERLLRARLRRVESLRKQKQFDEAQAQLDEVTKLAPRLLEPLMEQGNLYEDIARTDPSKWGTAYNYWKRLAAQLERGRPRRIEYYEAYLHMATALEALKQKDQAAATLKGVMTLSPSVGSPEMKAKYQAFLSRLSQ
jgi:outer membrane protein assembly factor BamD (BamD/ComL family)